MVVDAWRVENKWFEYGHSSDNGPFCSQRSLDCLHIIGKLLVLLHTDNCFLPFKLAGGLLSYVRWSIFRCYPMIYGETKRVLKLISVTSAVFLVSIFPDGAVYNKLFTEINIFVIFQGVRSLHGRSYGKHDASSTLILILHWRYDPFVVPLHT